MPVQPHGQAEFDCVSVFPGPAQGEITAAAGKDRQDLPIDLYAATFSPVRNAQVDGNIYRVFGQDREFGSLLLRECRFLPQTHLLFQPIDLGSDVEIDVDGIVIVEIDSVSEFAELFHARTGAAPERIKGLAEDFPVS